MDSLLKCPLRCRINDTIWLTITQIVGLKWMDIADGGECCYFMKKEKVNFILPTEASVKHITQKKDH